MRPRSHVPHLLSAPARGICRRQAPRARSNQRKPQKKRPRIDTGPRRSPSACSETVETICGTENSAPVLAPVRTLRVALARVRTHARARAQARTCTAAADGPSRSGPSKRCRGSILGDVSAHADGERRGAGSHRRVASERPRCDASLGVLRTDTGPSAFAVGMLRDISKKKIGGIKSVWAVKAAARIYFWHSLGACARCAVRAVLYVRTCCVFVRCALCCARRAARAYVCALVCLPVYQCA